MNSSDVTIFFSFIAGILTFFSPCILPLIPSYLSYITGFSVNELAGKDNKKVLVTTVISSVFFVLGFSFVFISFGLGFALLGRALIYFNDIIRIVGGIVIIFFGLVISGILKIPFLEMDKRLTVRNKPLGYAGAVLVGMAFSFGWAPCVGPLLSSILIVAETQHSLFGGFMLLFAYSLGLGVPIIISAAAFNYLLSFFGKIKDHLKFISMISGVLLVILGFVVIADGIGYLVAIINAIFHPRPVKA